MIIMIKNAPKNVQWLTWYINQQKNPKQFLNALLSPRFKPSPNDFAYSDKECQIGIS